jgi:hypothetical protein
MSDYAPNSPEPTGSTSFRGRRATLAALLAAIVALGVALALLLANTNSHGSPAAAGQPTTPSETSPSPSVKTTFPMHPTTPTPADHGGSGGGASGGGGMGSGHGSSGPPSAGGTTPPVTPHLELHAFPTGPPSVDESACPAHVSFASVISVSRGPVIVTYRWVRSDGAQSPISSVDFTGTGPQLQTVFATWDLGGNHDGSEQLHVLTPFATTAEVMPFSVHCAPTVGISGVSATPAAGTCDSLATTLHATVTIGRSPVQVWYHWVVDGHAYPSHALPGTTVADQSISDPFIFSTSVHGRSLHPVRLVIDSPYMVTSSSSYMSVDCA